MLKRKEEENKRNKMESKVKLVNDLQNKIQNNEENDENKEKYRDDDNNQYSKDIHDLSFEPDEGSKKKRRNRSGSVDDRKYKNDNVKCNCIII